MNRRDIMRKFKITFNGVKIIEKELNLFSTDDLSHKKYTEEDVRLMETLIKDKYLLPKDAVQINNSYDYVTPDGYIYKERGSTGLFFKAKLNMVNGYLYCGINYKNNMRCSKRVHRIVAQTFIENPFNKTIVNHINGIKHDNRVCNLEWSTVSENTKHAFDSGLAFNLSGYDDSQSKPVTMFNMQGEPIKSFGSISIASRETNIPKTTICRHCKDEIISTKHQVYFRYQ